MLRIIGIVLLCFIVVNLFLGLFHMMRSGDSRNSKTLRALVIRVALSVLLFLVIVVTSQYGVFPE